MEWRATAAAAAPPRARPMAWRSPWATGRHGWRAAARTTISGVVVRIGREPPLPVTPLKRSLADRGGRRHVAGLRCADLLPDSKHGDGSIYGDTCEWHRMYRVDITKENAIRNQYEFLVQRMGGPPLFSQRRGHPALIAHHRPFPVTHRAAERWLHHMQQAVDTTESISPDIKTKMMNFFRHTAYFLVAGNEMTSRPSSSTLQTCNEQTS